MEKQEVLIPEDGPLKQFALCFFVAVERSKIRMGWFPFSFVSGLVHICMPVT